MTYVKGLQRVIDHDAHSQTDYVKTLRTYLDNNMNIAQTARDLFIHRTSLIARLERIASLLDIDLDNPNDRLQLAINLRMLSQS